jgi:hypothetical protein
MTVALKRDVVPRLRERGFKGSFPHFRRATLPRVDYLTFQFSSSGGSFVVEVATSGTDGRPDGYGSELPIEKLNTHYFCESYRLGTDRSPGGDHWYHFGPRSYDPDTPLREGAFYADIARTVLEDFDGGGEEWLKRRSIAV